MSKRSGFCLHLPWFDLAFHPRSGWASSEPSGSEDLVTRGFDVEPGGQLAVDCQRGSIEVRPGEERRVEIEVRRWAATDDREAAERLFAAMVLSIAQEAGRVAVHVAARAEAGVEEDDRRLGWRVAVRVPPRFDLDLATHAGDIEVGDVEGTVHCRTHAGAVELGRVKGSCRLASSAGSIGLRELVGSVDAQSQAGNVSVAFRGPLAADSRLATAVGTVKARLAADTGAELDASTLVGRVLTSGDLGFAGETTARSLRGRVGGGGPRLTLRSHAGNILLKRI